MAIKLCHFVVLSLWTIGNLPPERDPRSTWLLVKIPCSGVVLYKCDISVNAMFIRYRLGCLTRQPLRN